MIPILILVGCARKTDDEIIRPKTGQALLREQIHICNENGCIAEYGTSAWDGRIINFHCNCNFREEVN